MQSMKCFIYDLILISQLEVWMNIEFWNIPLFKLHYLFDYLSNKSKYSLHKKNSFCLSCSNSLKVCVVLWHLSSRFVYMGIERVADKSIWESRLYSIKLLLEWSGNPNLIWWNIDHKLISQVSWNKKKQELFIIFKCTWQEK